MSNRYWPYEAIGVVLTAEEAEAFTEVYCKGKTIPDVYKEDETLDLYLSCEEGFDIVQEYGDYGLFTAHIRSIAEPNISGHIKEGSLICPLSYVNVLDQMGRSEDDPLFESPYVVQEDMITEAKLRYGEFLPEDFPYEKRTGIISGVFYG